MWVTCLQTGANCTIANNIAIVDGRWNGYPISASNFEGLHVGPNLVHGFNSTSIVHDPELADFVSLISEHDPMLLEPPSTEQREGYDFRITSSQSPAVGQASSVWYLCEDFLGKLRKDPSTLGAFEYFAESQPSVTASMAFNLTECYTRLTLD
jgi:hypothetical protein